MVPPDVRTRRWTRIEYDRLIDLGVLQTEDSIELIGGEMIVAEPQSAQHYTAISRTTGILQDVFRCRLGCPDARPDRAR
jgi:hypothetical protein